MARRAMPQIHSASHQMTPDPPLHPQIQSRGWGFERRRACSSSTAPCWGAKRARTCTGFSSQRPCPKWSPETLSGTDSCWGKRDWASLGEDGPAGLIAEFVLANDVADYVRFRAVCRPWRRCSVDPRSQGALDGRFHPRQWLMLDKAHVGPRCHRFLNVSTGECIRTDLPELTLLALTPEGLLLLLHEPTLTVRLLNPLTRQLTDLPPVTALMTEEQRGRRSRGNMRDTISVYSAGLASTVAVAVSFRFPTVLAVAKPGDERWTLVYDKFMDSTLPFAGRFYCAIGSSVMVLTTSSESHPPRLVTAIEPRRSFNFCRMSGSLHLFDNAGELLLVHRSPRLDRDAQRGKYKMEYMVYQVDLATGALVPIKDLRGRAVFMGRRRVISVPVAVGTWAFPSLAADTLYPGCDCEEKTMRNKIQGYNVADGSSQPCHHDSCVEMEQPYSMVDCLSYCIQGNGRQLA